MRIGSNCHMWACLLAAACETASDATGDTGDGPPFNLPIYIQPTRECRAPLPGEPPGVSDGSRVCTWQSVAGATEEGRRFRDYADCAVVRTQRPYYSVPPSGTYGADDPRLNDPTYVAELTWVRGQIEAVGCACCHSDAAPDGPVRWSIDLPGNWVTSMSDRDLAALADWIDTSMFERFPSTINNGFMRPHGLPSTDPERIAAFFAAEAASRGLTREQFADAPPTGGPLLELADYVPGPCEAGEGVNADGVITWTGGPARYVHVLAPGSANPTVPPDRDTPPGTLWRIDVPHAGEPLAPGSVRYGETPPGTTQRFPEASPPSALEQGHDYYLYISRDMFQPITRCVFTRGA